MRPLPACACTTSQYTITNTTYYLVSGCYQLTTDGTVNVDKLGNYYFNVAAISGTRTYTYFPTGVTSVANVTALMPICSGPAVSNNDQVYCNDNRLYLSYPYVDRLGLAYEFSSTVANAGLPPAALRTAACTRTARRPWRRRARRSTRPGPTTSTRPSH